MISKYHRWYQALVQQARKRAVPPAYLETHHIKPRSLGGSDQPNNLVRLTYREHFLAHWLLTKMHKGAARRKMLYALLQMCRPGKGADRLYTSWQYDAARRAIKTAQTGRVVSVETRLKMAAARFGTTASTATRRKMSRSQMGNTNNRGKSYSNKSRAVARRAGKCK